MVNVTITTTADANPTASGQGAPLVVRVYQLASPAGFENAEFFRLYNQDTATLGSDLLKKDEYLMAPGTTKSVKLEPASPVKPIGVFAAYRDFRNATWRGTAEVPANKTTDMTVSADAKGITVKAAPAPAPPAS